MQVLEKKNSKLLERTEVRVDFGDKAGTLSRKEAVKLIADELRVDQSKVGIVALRTGSGSKNLVGLFHVYQSGDAMKTLHQKYLTVRLLTKEEREALKQAKKKAEQPKAK